MNPPADWYPDPTGRHEQRYWDGAQWTEHVFTDGVQGVNSLDAPAEPEAVPSDGATEPEPEPTSDAAPDPEPAVDSSDPAAVEASTATEPAFGGAYADLTPRRDTTDEDADLWTPAGEGAETDDESPDDAGDAPLDVDAAQAQPADEVVDPAIEADDVVATLEEVEGSADEPTSGMLQDAFILSPETASRLVGQQPDHEDAAEAEETVPEESSEVSNALADAPPPSTGAIDAPPPSGAPLITATSAAGLGITGELVSGAFSEREDDGPIALQNGRLLRCHVEPGSGVIARQGTMVAYQGQVQFERQGAGGVGRALKRAATGEGMAMMRVEGSGDVFFADDAQHVFLLELDGAGPGISVNGRNVLAFSASLSWDIERVKGASLLAGGLFNTMLTGSGWVALVTDGEPVVLRTDEAPTFVDVNALVAWSGGLATRVVNQVSAKSLVGLGSGEAFQMAFDGSGIVIVQPSEGPYQGAAAT